MTPDTAESSRSDAIDELAQQLGMAVVRRLGRQPLASGIAPDRRYVWVKVRGMRSRLYLPLFSFDNYETSVGVRSVVRSRNNWRPMSWLFNGQPGRNCAQVAGPWLSESGPSARLGSELHQALAREEHRASLGRGGDPASHAYWERDLARKLGIRLPSHSSVHWGEAFDGSHDDPWLPLEGSPEDRRAGKPGRTQMGLARPAGWR